HQRLRRLGQEKRRLAAVLRGGGALKHPLLHQLDHQTAGGGNGHAQHARELAGGDAGRASHLEEHAQLRQRHVRALPLAQAHAVQAVERLPVGGAKAGKVIALYGLIIRHRGTIGQHRSTCAVNRLRAPTACHPYICSLRCRSHARDVASREPATRDATMTLTYDPAAAQAHLRAADPALAGVIESVGPLEIHAGRRPYEALVRSIRYQQLAGPAALAIERRFLALYGADGAVPTPEQLLATDLETLRSAGVSRQKAGYLLDLAAKTQTGVVGDHLADLS